MHQKLKSAWLPRSSLRETSLAKDLKSKRLSLLYTLVFPIVLRKINNSTAPHQVQPFVVISGFFSLSALKSSAVKQLWGINNQLYQESGHILVWLLPMRLCLFATLSLLYSHGHRATLAIVVERAATTKKGNFYAENLALKLLSSFSFLLNPFSKGYPKGKNENEKDREKSKSIRK